MRQRARFHMRIGVIFACMLPSFAVHSEPLGRLFFTAERRAALDRQRQANALELAPMQGESLSLDGIVKRSSGRNTVWVNGHAQHDRANPAGIAADLQRGDPARAVISSGNSHSVSLRVGETANRATGEKKDGLDGGTIVIKRVPLRP